MNKPIVMDVINHPSKYVLKGKIADAYLSRVFISTRDAMKAMDLDEPSLWENIAIVKTTRKWTEEDKEKVRKIILDKGKGYYTDVIIEEEWT